MNCKTTIARPRAAMLPTPLKLTCWVFAAVMMIFAGCDRSVDGDAVHRVGVTGLVTLDGRPLQAGAIVFHSPAGTSKASTITAYGLVENGRYQIDAESGPAVGTARVEIRAKPLEREELEEALDAGVTRRSHRAPPPTVVAIPEKYGEKSKLRVKLSSGQENRHDFQLDSST